MGKLRFNKPFRSAESRIGERYGRIVVMSVPSKGRLIVKCDCGNEKNVPLGSLTMGHVQSCGCLALDILRNRNRVHDHAARDTKNPTYISWSNMICRCNNPNRQFWHRYGGRGIEVCKKWKWFPNFLEDMGPRPHGHTLDRIDSNKNYEPSNCRWAPSKTQARNTSRTLRCCDGTPLIDWTEKYGITKSQINYRRIDGWTPDEIRDYYMAKLGMLA